MVSRTRGTVMSWGSGSRMINRDIETMADLFVKELSPVAVYLFGSHAEDIETENSDYDFYIVVKDFESDMLRLTQRAYKAIRNNQNRPVDIIINTDSTFRERVEAGRALECDVKEKGVILYENRNEIRVPLFMKGEELPPGYFDSPDPYKNPPSSRYNMRAMVNYALKNGKNITDLTIEEVRPFLIG